LVLLAFATLSLAKDQEKPSFVQKAAHVLTHPSEILTGHKPEQPKVMKDVCPECHKDHEKPLGHHVKGIMEEAARTGQAGWEATKDKVVETLGSASDAVKHGLYHTKPEEPAGAWETIKGGMESVKEKLVGSEESSHRHHKVEEPAGAWDKIKEKFVGADDSSHRHRAHKAEDHSTGAWNTIKNGMESVKDKLVGGADATAKAASDAAKQATHTHYPSSMGEVCVICQQKHREEEPTGVWESFKEGVETVKDKIIGGGDDVRHKGSQKSEEYLHDAKDGLGRARAAVEYASRYATETASDMASKASDALHDTVLPSNKAPDHVPDKMKDVCPECHKHDAATPLQDLKHTAETLKDDITSGASRVARDLKHGAEDLTTRAADTVTRPLRDLKHGAEDLTGRAADAVRHGAEDVTGRAYDAARDLQHGAENVKDRAYDKARDLKYGAEDMAARATDTVTKPLRDLKHGAEYVTDQVRSGAEDVKNKIADSVPDVSPRGIKDRMAAMKDSVVDTVTKPFQHFKGEAEDASHRVADTASGIKEGAENVKDRITDTAYGIKERAEDMGRQVTHSWAHEGMPSNWYAEMLETKELIEKQVQDVIRGGAKMEHLSYVQHSAERINGSWISYLNDNGKEYLDVQLRDGIDARSFDALKALNMARLSYGMPEKDDLSDVNVQIHQREKPYYFVRTTRILPNGAWTRYENDNGAELLTEGHLNKKAITQSTPEKSRHDKHPLINMFRRTFGLAELVEKESS